MEKPLYQIAVERIIGRLVGAKGVRRDRAIALFTDAALGPMKPDDSRRTAVELRRILFPELGR